MNQLEPHQEKPSERPLATARWSAPADMKTFTEGDIWLGRDSEHRPIGFSDDRHVMLVAGSRGGKGTSSIVTNICLWPGSMVVIDPKGENAAITAARRGEGSRHSDGLYQKLYVLDPFETAAIDPKLRATFNPLDALDPEDDEVIDEAGRIADAIVVITKNSTDPFFDEQSRQLLKVLILHVVTSEDFEGRRNLITVRRLITAGDIEMKERLDPDGPQATGHELLFEGMRMNKALHGLISDAGEGFGSMLATAEKTFTNIIGTARNHTEFLDSGKMKRSLATTTPGFTLASLKTDPDGVSLFLTLPQRNMNTHFRWLRMMVTLVLTEMEKTQGKPATGHRVLLVLDEFAGLERLKIVETAAAQIAGFGVKMMFVLQTLTQLKAIYQDNWEVFIGSSGTKIFYGIDDMFTRDYVSKYLGEGEITRTTRNAGSNSGSSTAYASGTNTGSSHNWESGTTSSSGSNLSETKTFNSGASEGTSEGLHKRALLTPDEVGMTLSRIDDPNNPAYPGLELAIVPGRAPMIIRRTNYFEDRAFVRKFDPHPDHRFVPLPPQDEVIELSAPEEPPEDTQSRTRDASERFALTLFPGFAKRRPWMNSFGYLLGGIIGLTAASFLMLAIGGKGTGWTPLIGGGIVAGTYVYRSRRAIAEKIVRGHIADQHHNGADAAAVNRYIDSITITKFRNHLLGIK